MGVQSITTNIYECDHCHITSEDPTRWLQVWVINVAEPKFFDSVSCARTYMQETVTPLSQEAPALEQATPDNEKELPLEPDEPQPAE